MGHFNRDLLVYSCQAPKQRRIRIAPGVRLNLSKSGIGASVGRTGLRLGVNAKRRKYLSLGLPGSGLSYSSFFGRPVSPKTIKVVVYAVLIVALLCLGVLVALSMRNS